MFLFGRLIIIETWQFILLEMSLKIVHYYQDRLT